MFTNFVQGLGEALKGLVQITIKRINMFNRYINNYNYKVEKGGTLIHITVSDKEVAEALGKSIRGESTEEPELIQSENEKE